MLTLILFLAAPLLIAPLVVFGVRHLFAIFVRQSADLFLGREIHKEWSMTLGTDIALFNVIVFCLSWWGTVVLSSLRFHGVFIAAPFVSGVLLAIVVTALTLKTRLKLDNRDALAVGLLTCVGGNLPLVVLMPALLMLVNSQDMYWVIAEVPE